MAPSPGTRLGTYEVTAKLGAGGMGEVWRAVDTRLGREVALKLLPAGLADDGERNARFEREARVLASLNHPNIAHLYGIEHIDGRHVLVMELVEGEDLSQRLARGPIPVDEAIPIARQVAEALDAAHEQGIVHRDLKPANVKLRPDATVKVLDFGLAKALEPAAPGAAADLAHSPTLTHAATQAGLILGTAAYMSPEQAKGTAVDRRADIWAFGVVLYEMLTGARMFAGDSVAETLAGVLKTEIDLSGLPAGTPETVRHLLRRCLERDPRRRLRDIGEASFALSDPEIATPAVPNEVTATSRRLRVRDLLIGVPGVLVLTALAWTAGRLTHEAPVRPVSRLHVVLPDGTEIDDDGPAMLSPDGTSIVFRFSGRDDDARVAVRRLDELTFKALPGTSGGYEPFWSPDGRSIGYFTSHLTTVDASGLQPPRKLAEVRDGRGASWGRGGVILYAPEPAGVIFRVDAGGGVPRPVTTLDTARGETAHQRPQFLPDGTHFLYLVRSDRPENAGIFVGTLDGSLKRKILDLDVAVTYAAPGYLLAVQAGNLIARRFDPDRQEVSGEPRVIATGVDYHERWSSAPVSTSDTGLLVYHPPSRDVLRQVARYDRAGARKESIGEPGDFNLDLSPDGARLAFDRIDSELRRPVVWIHDLARDVRSRLIADGAASGPVWSPQGLRIAYAAERAHELVVAARNASGGAEQVFWRDPSINEPVDWSPDGKLLLVETAGAAERGNLVLVPADGSGATTPFAKTPADENSGRFSPDGTLVAYVSDQSGKDEIYVQPLPQTGATWLVSRRGGSAPRWSGDGREIFYVEPGTRAGGEALVAVTVARQGAELRLGVPATLGPIASIDYEPVAGGREFLVATPVAEAVTPPPVLIDNWVALAEPR